MSYINTENAVYERTIRLIGEEKQEKLKNSTVAVFGLGGVGSYAVEALARAGVGCLILCDSEKIEASNINRQLYALHSTIGKYKVDIASDRIKDINPGIEVIKYNMFADKDNLDEILTVDTDYIIDAIDSVHSKIDIIRYAKQRDIKVISCMGTGNRVDNTSFVITDIKKTHTCPLAKKIRKQLAVDSITHVDVLYSPNKSITSVDKIIASISYVPSTAGLMLAGHVIRWLISEKGEI